MDKPILLAGAPFLELYGARGVSYYFPLGIGYLASYLEKHGRTVRIIAESEGTDVYDELAAAIQTGEHLFVGISAMTPAFPAAVRLAKIVRRHAPGTPVVLGGPHASAMGASILAEQDEFDFLCVGEGEITALELAGALAAQRTDFGDIRGLVWRDADGKVVANPPREFHAELDDFPLPARHLVDFDKFSLHSHVSLGQGRGATIVTGRGCPFGCIFCSAHLTSGRKPRFHSDDYVIGEIRLLRDRYGIRYLFLEDDTFTAVRERVRRLCRRITDEKLGVTLGCFSRVDVFDEELAGLLRDAGFRLVIFGIESGVPEVLEKIRKGISLDKARRAIELCRSHGIKSFASFVVGFPFETRELIARTIDFGKGLDASVITFNPFVPFPGTPLFDPARHKPAAPDGWAKFLTTDEPPFDITPDTPARELKAMVDRAHVAYYLRPKRLLGILRDTRSLSDLAALGKSFLIMLRRSVF